MVESKYKQYLETKKVPTLTKVDVNELNELRKEHFNKNIDRNCSDCIKNAFLEVGAKLWGEPIVKKQTFPKHTLKESGVMSVMYGALNDTTGKHYFIRLAHSLIQNLHIQRISIENIYHYNCTEGHFVFRLNNQILNYKKIQAKGYDSKCNPKAYEELTKHKAITKTKPKSIKTDMLVFLNGTERELKELLKITECKYIFTHIQLDNPLPQRPKLLEGNLYICSK